MNESMNVRENGGAGTGEEQNGVGQGGPSGNQPTPSATSIGTAPGVTGIDLLVPSGQDGRLTRQTILARSKLDNAVSGGLPSFNGGTTGNHGNLKNQPANGGNLTEAAPLAPTGDKAEVAEINSNMPNSLEFAPPKPTGGRAEVDEEEGRKKTRKRISGAERKRRKALKEQNETSPMAAVSQSNTGTGKRPKISGETPPSDKQANKKPRKGSAPVQGLPARRGVQPQPSTGLTYAQKTNPMTMVVTDEGHPEKALTAQQFELFQEAVMAEIDKTPPEQWPKFEESFARGGVFIIVAAEQATKEWLSTRIDTLKPWEGAAFKLGGVELLQRMVKATVWLSGTPPEPKVILDRLGKHNPSLKTSSWRIVQHDKKGEGKYPNLLVVQIPEPEAKALLALDDRPYFGMGRLKFKVARKVEGPEGMEVDGTAAS